MVKDHDSFKRLKKRKARRQSIRAKRAIIVENLIQKNKFPGAFLVKRKLKRRLAVKEFSAKFSAEVYEEYLIKMFLLEIDLGLVELPIIVEKPFSMSQFDHLKTFVWSLPKVIRFLLMYPFSAATIGELFDIKLNPLTFFYKKNKNLWEFLNFCEKFLHQEAKKKLFKEKKEQMMTQMLKPIFRRNVLNEKKKNNIGQEKHLKLYGMRHKLVFNKMLKWRFYNKRKSRRIKYIIKNLKIRNQSIADKKNTQLVRIFFLLNHLKENKKKETIKNVQKNPLDFFYEKHLKDIEQYLFK